MLRFVVGVAVLGLGLACAGVEVPEPAEGDPAEAAPPEEAFGPRPLVAQNEAGCGFTHRGPDGAIWFAEEIGGGYLLVNIEGTDVMIEPTEPLPPAKEKVAGKPKVELAAYTDDLVHVHVFRKEQTARVEVSIGDGTLEIETRVKENTCM
jgi:hypothetical protein